ncbi:adenylate kinase family protein [Mycoplasmopsis fermentans]|nr:nucleoside monophosphate kinase [Mycoplasmopsis fermentans]ADN69207.1 adenylate kinase [Mycoplasmopsis fermentans JER]ADV34738.1 Adenylate kinase [Mycoplasmopsis fermentans M64]VEU63795.1 adenylate kinase [Mycoplasmopsis fermentans]VEU67214.1 adenylate kinase [Mesomycoplasma conjunctivae]
MISKIKQHIVFMGPPGVGKGTVAAIIAEKYGLVHVSTGNIFREEIASQSELGLQVKKIVEAGQYVPDDITNTIVKNKIQALIKAKKIIMLDGYPRTIDQVNFLDSISNFKYVALELSAPEDVILKRLNGRRQCPKCKASFHIDFMPSTKGKYCDKCGAELILRKDDSIEAIKVRQKVYHDQTAPLLDYYKKYNLLLTFDATSDPETIAKNIVESLAKLKN